MSRAVRLTNSTSAMSSITGSVSGIVTIEVTPPAGRRLAGRSDRLAMFGARLADEDARIDEARQDARPAAVDDLCALGRGLVAALRGRRGDLPSSTMTTPGTSMPLRRIDDAAAFEMTSGRVRHGVHAERHPGRREQRLDHGHAHRDAHLDLFLR